jgi:hypothetical protein
LLREVGNSYFSILYDETTNHSNKKELQVAIRFFSEERSKTVTCHLETFYVSHATAENLSSCLFNSLDNASLCYNKLLMLGSDGLNVNKQVHRIINGRMQIERERKCLIDMGSCSIHTVHNAFLAGLKVFGEEVSDLIIDIYYFFKKYPSRWEHFAEIQT